MFYSQKIYTNKASYENLISYLRNINDEIPKIYENGFSANPLLVDTQIEASIEQVYKILLKIIKIIVRNFLLDEEIFNTIRITHPTAKKLLIHLKDTPYEIGSIRPDFLIEKNSGIKFCEINGRFTCNGLIISEYLSDFFSTLNANLVPYKTIENFLNKFNLNEKICIIKGREKGIDISLLYKELEKSVGLGNVIIANPSNLQLNNAGICVNGERCDQFIIELHQDELYSMDSEILVALFNVNTLNDFRTIAIVHDKRLFTLLSNYRFLKKYLSTEEAEFLIKFIPETKILPQNYDEFLLQNPSDWVFKKYLSGKGEGMYLGRDMDNVALKKLFDSRNDYICQKHIIQKQFSMSYYSYSAKESIEINNIYLVGAVSSFNDKYNGLTLVKGSSKQIVNVSGGGTIFYAHKKR